MIPRPFVSRSGPARSGEFSLFPNSLAITEFLSQGSSSRRFHHPLLKDHDLTTSLRQRRLQDLQLAGLRSVPRRPMSAPSGHWPTTSTPRPTGSASRQSVTPSFTSRTTARSPRPPSESPTAASGSSLPTPSRAIGPPCNGSAPAGRSSYPMSSRSPRSDGSSPQSARPTTKRTSGPSPRWGCGRERACTCRSATSMPRG
jgi:hypothetical protein